MPTLLDVKKRFQLIIRKESLSSNDREIERRRPDLFTFRTWTIHSKTMKGFFQTYNRDLTERLVLEQYLKDCNKNPNVRPPFGKRMLKMLQEVFDASST